MKDMLLFILCFYVVPALILGLVLLVFPSMAYVM